MRPSHDRNSYYWEQRLSGQFNLAATGHRAFGLQYNVTLYRTMLECVQDVCARNRLSIQGKRILDVGCGTGFFVAYWLNSGATQVYGLDITPTSVERLLQQFPSCHFARADIADGIPFGVEFDLISGINVLFHITDDERFLKSLENICASLVPKGVLIITDSFRQCRFAHAKHVKFRPLSFYQPVFERFGMSVVEEIPLFYLLDRSFIPFLGPSVIQFFQLGEVFYRIDRLLRGRGRSNGMGLKILLARRDEVEKSKNYY